MFVATLIAAPDGPGLHPHLAQALRNAWGGGDLIWLDPSFAAEFPVASPPADLAPLRRELDAARVDLVLQPAQARKKRVLLADMDSTMIQQECIDELADAAGMGDQVKEVTAQAMQGALDFGQALRMRVALLRGLPERTIAEVLATRITPMPGAAILVATMKAHGAYAALVSGGFTAFTAPVAAQLGFDENRANTLLVRDGKLTGQAAEPILGRDAKVAALDDITKQLGLSPQDVLAVGDGANDLGMLDRAGTGVALHAKPVVQDQAEHRINHGDLTALLFLQGYGQADFVSP